jgi:hypothetical protein
VLFTVDCLFLQSSKLFGEQARRVPEVNVLVDQPMHLIKPPLSEP